MSNSLAFMNSRAGGTIYTSRFVIPDPSSSDPNGSLQAVGGAVLPFGISQDASNTRPDNDIFNGGANNIAATVGQMIRVYVPGAKGISLYCNAAWAAGALLMPDANGYGIVCTPGMFYGARAQTAGVIGQFCTVDVVTGLLPISGPGAGVTVLTGSTDAITPHANGTYILTTAGVDATTLAAPTATTDDGVQITITSASAYAHTVTFTGGTLNDGSTTTATATFAAHAGASLILVAYQAKWYVVSQNQVTFS